MPTSNAELGNTLLLDRALARVNKTLRSNGAILRGILWHQEETGSEEESAPFYENNLVTLVSEPRSRINIDARGVDARGVNANTLFVMGIMSKGNDERGDLSDFTPGKQTVDSVHRNIASLVPHSEVVITVDLLPSHSYPCREASCIHFGADALCEMGYRSFNALIRAGAE